MNVLDDDLVHLFAAEELGTEDAALLNAIRRRISAHRFARRAVTLALVVGGVAGIVAFVMLVPPAIDPVRLLNELLGSPRNAMVALAGAIGVACWTTLSEA